MRIFKTKEFNRLARKERLSDDQLCLAVREMEAGLIDADLGSNLYKKRIAQGHRGKRGSFRTLLAYKEGNKIFFLYCFTKSERENITPGEKLGLKLMSKVLLNYSDTQLEEAKSVGVLVEISEGYNDE
ncbi:type II toxin-antitoxin system RelE/ParE family toxin [Aliamphritea hakodatensis]|uniref:type II toxin-antitoxin system RelE/ParE family toxin n=1 Tax=Aliamphritea hakodatensis TaxID=2895352 RepID=UPI0022FD748A|nr:type II toxin-antitoxin system RelE/ParE family toxin [Aliamphritea hakodatensis]